MIESILVLDATTRVVMNRVSWDPDRPETLNLLPGQILSTRHDGDIGWTLTESGEWIDPAPPEPYPKDQRIRQTRNRILDRTDRYMISDFPMSEETRSLWRQYRQALRDIPGQAGFPDEVVWPTEPGA